jgi:hypothetical protein
MIHSFHTGIIRLHIRLLDLAILNNKRIPLTPVTTEDSRAIERQIQLLGKIERGIGNEADLREMLVGLAWDGRMLCCAAVSAGSAPREQTWRKLKTYSALAGRIKNLAPGVHTIRSCQLRCTLDCSRFRTRKHR